MGDQDSTWVTYNFRIPETSDFFQGASSGSYGMGPCTGRSAESSESESLQHTAGLQGRSKKILSIRSTVFLQRPGTHLLSILKQKQEENLDKQW